LQFVTGQDGKIYYRSFHTDKAGDLALEKSGEASPASGNYPVWEGGAMGWRFQVTQFIPRAVAEANFVPEELPPGVERGDLRAALRCRLSAGKHSKEFWLGKSDDSYTTVVLGSDHYQIGYHVHTRELPFELKLLRAEQTNDPG